MVWTSLWQSLYPALVFDVLEEKAFVDYYGTVSRSGVASDSKVHYTR